MRSPVLAKKLLYPGQWYSYPYDVTRTKNRTVAFYVCAKEGMKKAALRHQPVRMLFAIPAILQQE